jgi:hypothetical protein
MRGRGCACSRPPRKSSAGISASTIFPTGSPRRSGRPFITGARGWPRRARARARLERSSPAARLPLAAQRLEALGKRLQAASPASVLHRGFVILRDEQGKPVLRRAKVKSGQRLAAEFADGSAPLRAE